MCRARSHPLAPEGTERRASPEQPGPRDAGNARSRRRLTRTLPAKKSSETTPAAVSSAAISCCQEKWSGKRGGGGNCTRIPVSASTFGDNDLRISTLPLAAPQQRDPGTDLHDLASVDARLERVCAAWSSLPEHVVLAILALVDSAGVVEANRLQPSS